MAHRARSTRPYRSDDSSSRPCWFPASARSPRAVTVNSTDPNTPPCVFWLNGYCRRASDCTFRHDSPFAIDRPRRDARADLPCNYFIGGRCRNGPTCPYKHHLPASALDFVEHQPFRRVPIPTPAAAAELPAISGKAPSQKPWEGALVLPSPTDLLRSVIRTNISVTYGPGLEVVKVALPSDSVTVSLSNLPSNIRKKDLIDVLRAHGDPLSLEMHRHVKHLPNATATYATHAAAAKAARELDGLHFDTAVIAAAAPEPAVGPASLRTNAAKLVWDQPTRSAVLGFSSSELAHRRALAVNGRAFDGKRIAAFYQNDRRPSVVVPNLPFSTDPVGLRALARADSIEFTAPSYEVEGARAGLQALLARYGPLDSFHILPHLPNDHKLRAIVYFTRSEHLEAAIGALHGTRQRCVAASRVWFHRAYSLKYAISVPQFAVIRQRINDLRVNQRTLTSLRVIEPEASKGHVVLQIQAEHPALLARLKVALEIIIRGQVLRDLDGRVLWDSTFFSGGASRSFLQGMNDEGKVFITCDTKQRHLTVCGSPEDIADASKRVLSRYTAYRVGRRTIASPEQSLCLSTEGHLSAVRATLGEDSVPLNVPDRPLFFGGSNEQVATVPGVVNHIMHDQHELSQKDSPGDKHAVGAVCPVCRSEVTQPVHLLCGHDYCTTCLQLYLVSSSSSEARVFPVRCIGPSTLPTPPGLTIKRPLTCDAPINVSVIRELLRPEEEAALLDASLTAHVYANPGVYKFCPTPDCDQVYRVAPPGAPKVFTCLVCLASTCTACHSAHPGLTCARHRLLLSAHNQRPQSIKRCPSDCGALLQKQDGCNHVQCPICKVHMCWICLQMFPNGGVYEHIAAVHGEGFMPGVLPANMLLL